MKYLLILLLAPLFSYSQLTSAGNIQAQFGVDWPKPVDLAYSARLSGGINIDYVAMIGIGAGVTKFDKVDNLYIPLFGNITLTGNARSKVFPVLNLQPGYGVYKQEIITSTTLKTITGGFNYSIAGGIGISGDSKVKTVITVGYSQYNFKVSNGTKFNYNGLCVRLGLMIL